MRETAGQEALEGYHAADFIQKAWKIDRHGLGQVKFDLRFNDLDSIINSGQKAHEVGMLTQTQADQYRQDALFSAGKWYADYCADEFNFKPERAEEFVGTFRGLIGKEQADQAILTGFFAKTLGQQPREVIVDGLTDKNGLWKKMVPDNPFKLSKSQQKTLFNYYHQNMFTSAAIVKKALGAALNREVIRREIGNEAEQMRHLFWVNFDRALVPLIICGGAVALATLPQWWMFGWVVNQQLTNPEQITASKEAVLLADSLLLLKAGGWTIYANNLGVVKEQRNILKYPLGAMWGNLKHYLTTGKAPGTPQV